MNVLKFTALGLILSIINIGNKNPKLPVLQFKDRNVIEYKELIKNGSTKAWVQLKDAIASDCDDSCFWGEVEISKEIIKDASIISLPTEGIINIVILPTKNSKIILPNHSSIIE